MRMNVMLIAAALVIAGSAPLHAAGTTTLELQGGTAMSKGPFKDDSRTGFVVEANLQHMFLPMVGIGGNMAYTNFQASDAINNGAAILYGPGSSIGYTIWNYVAYGVLAMPIGRVKPYARGGYGIYNPKVQLRSAAGVLDDTRREPGYLAGGGIGVQVTSDVAVGADVTWHEYHDTLIDQDNSWVSAKLQVTLLVPRWDAGLKP